MRMISNLSQLVYGSMMGERRGLSPVLVLVVIALVFAFNLGMPGSAGSCYPGKSWLSR